jgi:hypothetical protein
MGRMTLSPRPMAVTGRSTDRCPQSKKLPFKQPIWRCGASSLAYIWMRPFRGSYIGRRDTVAG